MTHTDNKSLVEKTEKWTAAYSLKDCPFCGSNKIVIKSRKTACVECRNCGAYNIKTGDNMVQKAVMAWNKRTTPIKSNDEGFEYWLLEIIRQNALELSRQSCSHIGAAIQAFNMALNELRSKA